jgi:hypothetical protein
MSEKAKYDFSIDRYQVKFLDENTGQFKYGICQNPNFTKEAGEAFAQGFLLVEDAVLPDLWEVEIDKVIDIPLCNWTTVMETEYDKYVKAEFEKAQKLSDSINGFGVGAMFSIGVADGSAYYVVIRIRKTNRCKVEWRGFDPDRYQDHHFQLGGWFSSDEIKRYCEPRIKFSALAKR